jgi:predicted  nucleic acid-binding Zn-ribbon protein
MSAMQQEGKIMKYFEVPDLHADAKWIDTIVSVLKCVIWEARNYNVDFVVFPGDMHHSNLYITKEYNRFREKIKELLQVCPCAAVVGTPGHENEAMYGPLEDLGLVLMRPGTVYKIGPAILFGVPELTKSTIQATLSLNAEEANAKAEELFIRYIDEFVAPARAQHADKPAIGVLHGTVSDYSRENELDVVKRSSAIVIRTEDMERANLTRWSLGHIHTPWESRKINAGYAGSWGLSWGETGFVPAMNLVVDGVVTRRIPYGTPERRKISSPLASYDPNIAYWLNTIYTTATTPIGHSWSRITYETVKQETRRATKEQAENATLSALFKIADPTVDQATLETVKELGETTDFFTTQRTVTVDDVTIKGAIFWAGKTISLNLRDLPDGLTQIMGANGEGKSSLAAFCTPYPIIVGKDTKSGRQSAIKDFFDSPESMIRKTVTLNGIEHQHLITIKGAHTQTPKVECYLTIDGVPALDRGTFDEMMEKCEELYGSFSDYLLTTFYVQPLQGKTGSSLMSATMTDIRDLVQAIAGIDREAQKRAALDQVANLEGDIKTKRDWIKGAEDFAVDIEEIKKEINNLDAVLVQKHNEINAVVTTGKRKRVELDALQSKKKADDEAWIAKQAGRNEIIKRNTEKKSAYSTELARYNERLSSAQIDIKVKNNEASNKYKSELSFYTNRKQSLESEITRLNHPCPNCKWLDPLAETKIKKAREELTRLSIPVEPNLKSIPESVEGKPKEPILESVPDEEQRPFSTIESDIKDTETLLETLREELSTLKANIASTETEIKNKREAIVKATEQAKKIESTKTEIVRLEALLGRWKYIATMLRADKIPAIELDMVLDTIDSEATKNIEPYLDGRYSFSTRTQKQGKKTIVDDFDIIIHDNVTGKSKSFIEFSPGQKAFLNDAYIKALIKVRNNRSHAAYSPIISDEADGPIQPEMVPAYYEMQSSYYAGAEKVLVVSHAPDAHNYITNSVSVSSLTT